MSTPRRRARTCFVYPDTAIIQGDAEGLVGAMKSSVLKIREGKKPD
jgi:hypothetical protein